MIDKILTSYDPPPIPIRSFDWSAVTDNYEPGCPIGYGTTESEAIDDLNEQLDMEEDRLAEERFIEREYY